MNVPPVISGMRVRWCEDGSFYLPRANKELQRKMDNEYDRVPGELKWFPRTQEAGWSIDTIKHVFKDHGCYVIGKGPSIDRLSEEDFTDRDDPIICINESVHVIEKLELPNPLFVFQQDMSLRETCLPKRATLILAKHASHWYSKLKSKIIIDVKDYKSKATNLSVHVVTMLLKDLGCSCITYMGFDACLTGDTTYSQIVDYEPTRGGNPKRFLDHKKVIEESCGDLPHKFRLPRKRAVKTD